MPALPTNVAFRNALQGMTVTGVVTHYDYPPESLGELPAAFLIPGGSSLGDFTVSCTNENKQRTLGYVICLEASAQDKNAQNYDLLATMRDNLESALDTLLVPTFVNFYNYDITDGTYAVAGIEYWALTATITIRSV